jgi:hypothetical protein
LQAIADSNTVDAVSRSRPNKATLRDTNADESVGLLQPPESNLRIVCTVVMNMDELRSRLEQAQQKTRSSVDLTRRLIDRSFLQLKESHRLLYAAERSKELLVAVLEVHALAHHSSHEKAKSGLTEIQTD